MRRELYIKIGIPAECIQWGLIVALLATLLGLQLLFLASINRSVAWGCCSHRTRA